MDTLPIIIVTAVVTAFINGAVAVAIFRRVEENIKLDFQKQLEMFKTELQKDVIEHQVKFSRNYPKAVETIETIRQKFICVHMISDGFSWDHLNSVTDEEYAKNELELKTALTDLHEYNTYNQIYLPDNIANQITDIVGKVYFLCIIMLQVRNLENMSAMENTPFQWAVTQFDSMRPDKIDPKTKYAAVLYSTSVMKEMQALAKKLEIIYRSVADTS